MPIISTSFDIMWRPEKMAHYVVEHHTWDDARVLALFAEALRDHEKMTTQ